MADMQAEQAEGRGSEDHVGGPSLAGPSILEPTSGRVEAHG